MKILNESYDDDKDVYYYDAICDLKIPIEIRVGFPKSQVGESKISKEQIKNEILDKDFLDEISYYLDKISSDMVTTELGLYRGANISKFYTDNLSIDIKMIH